MACSFFVEEPEGTVWQCDPAALESAHLSIGYHYLARIISRLASRLVDEDFVFVLTWNKKRVPSEGSNVIVFTLADEHARVPRYFSRVGLVCKPYGIAPSLGMPHPFPRDRLDWMRLARFLRNAADGSGTRLRYAFRILTGQHARVETVPLGYLDPRSEPLVPLAKRSIDIFFSGHIPQRSRYAGLRALVAMPKEVSRRELVRVLETPELRDRYSIDLRLTGDFASSAFGFDDSYLLSLAMSKIALCPTGNSVETYRLFEAMRAGCVIISEPLPKHWFYRGSPIITVASWRELPSVLSDLFADPAGMQVIGERTFAWWRDVCSESAVAERAGAWIDALRLGTAGASSLSTNRIARAS